MTSRRAFIRDSALTLAVAGTVSLPRIARATTQRSQQRIMIAETFVFPEWLRAMHSMVNQGTRADGAFWTAFQATALLTQRHNFSMRNDELTLLSLPAPGVEPFTADNARALARLANDQLADVVRDARGRQVGLATISAFDARAAYEAERATVSLGLSGISLGTNRGMRLDHRNLWPVYEFAANAQVPIYLPTAYAPMTGDVPYRAMGRAGVLVGAAADSGQHALQLIFGGVLDAFPNLSVVLARFGEATPYWYGRLTDTYAALHGAGSVLPQHSIEHYFQHNLLLTSADMSLPTLQFCSVMFKKGRIIATPETASLAGFAQQAGSVSSSALWRNA